MNFFKVTQENSPNSNEFVVSYAQKVKTRASMFSGTLEGPAHHVSSRLKSLLQMQ